MGGDELNEVLHDDWALLDDEVMTEEEDAAIPSESGEESDWRIY